MLLIRRVFVGIKTITRIYSFDKGIQIGSPYSVMVQLQNIRGKIHARCQKISLCRKFDIAAVEEAPFAQRKPGDKRTVVDKTDPALIVGIKRTETAGIVIPQDISPDRSDGKALSFPQIGHRDSPAPGSGPDRIVVVKILPAAVIEFFSMRPGRGIQIPPGGIRIGQIDTLHMEIGVSENAGRVIAVVLMKM